MISLGKKLVGRKRDELRQEGDKFVVKTNQNTVYTWKTLTKN